MRAFSSILSSMLAFSMMISLNTSGTCAPESAIDTAPATSEAAPPSVADLQKECQAKQERLQVAISKFGEMGVGVTPFQAQLDESKQLLSDGKETEASGILSRLERSLVDQQNRYYNNKWQTWHNERKLLTQAFIKRGGMAASPPRTIKSNSMSKAVGSVVSKKDTKYNPMIYPIAR